MRLVRSAVVGLLLVGAVARAEDSAALATQAPPFEIEEKGRISVAVPHAFSQEEATERIGYLVAYWKKRFGVDVEKRADQIFVSGNMFGLAIRARFTITATQVQGIAADPGWPWGGRAQTYAERKLKKYLHPSYDEP